MPAHAHVAAFADVHLPAGSLLMAVATVLGAWLALRRPGRSDVQLGVARWQDRLTPLQRRLAGGCHLNRPIDRLVTQAGFSLARLDNFYMKGPKPMGYIFEGVATKT